MLDRTKRKLEGFKKKILGKRKLYLGVSIYLLKPKYNGKRDFRR